MSTITEQTNWSLDRMKSAVDAPAIHIPKNLKGDELRGFLLNCAKEITLSKVKGM